MTSPRKIFYPIALLLGIVALIINIAWHEQMDQYSKYTAQRLHAALEQNIPYVRDAETSHMAKVEKILYQSGWTFTVTASVCILVAIFRREEGRYVIPFAIIAFAAMAFMLL